MLGNADEFLIGDYNGDGTVSDDGEFRVALLDMTVTGRWGLYPHLEAFGDGTGALRRAIDAGLLGALEEGPVETTDAFARRLLDSPTLWIRSCRDRAPAGMHAGRGEGSGWGADATNPGITVSMSRASLLLLRYVPYRIVSYRQS